MASLWSSFSFMDKIRIAGTGAAMILALFKIREAYDNRPSAYELSRARQALSIIEEIENEYHQDAFTLKRKKMIQHYNSYKESKNVSDWGTDLDPSIFQEYCEICENWLSILRPIYTNASIQAIYSTDFVGKGFPGKHRIRNLINICIPVLAENLQESENVSWNIQAPREFVYFFQAYGDTFIQPENQKDILLQFNPKSLQLLGQLNKPPSNLARVLHEISKNKSVSNKISQKNSQKFKSSKKKVIPPDRG